MQRQFCVEIPLQTRLVLGREALIMRRIGRTGGKDKRSLYGGDVERSVTTECMSREDPLIPLGPAHSMITPVRLLKCTEL